MGRNAERSACLHIEDKSNPAKGQLTSQRWIQLCEGKVSLFIVCTEFCLHFNHDYWLMEIKVSHYVIWTDIG